MKYIYSIRFTEAAVSGMNLEEHGYQVNRKRVQRLMRILGFEAIYPKPRTTTTHPEHKKYPYLLRQIKVQRPNQVWCADITYIPMPSGKKQLRYAAKKKIPFVWFELDDEVKNMETGEQISATAENWLP